MFCRCGTPSAAAAAAVSTGIRRASPRFQKGQDAKNNTNAEAEEHNVKKPKLTSVPEGAVKATTRRSSCKSPVSTQVSAARPTLGGDLVYHIIYPNKQLSLHIKSKQSSKTIKTINYLEAFGPQLSSSPALQEGESDHIVGINGKSLPSEQSQEYYITTMAILKHCERPLRLSFR